MKNFTIFAPPLARPGPKPEAMSLVFVKDGFCWPALLIPLPWLLFRGLFFEAALYVLVMAGLAAVPGAFEAPAALAMLAIAVALGVLGNDIRRFALGRRGWRLVGAASGRSVDEAEIRWFLGRSETPDTQEMPAAPAAHLAPSAAPSAQPVAAPVIGLFPVPGGAR